MPKNQPKIDDKNYRTQRKLLDKERMKLGKRLNKLRQQGKDIQSSNHNNGQDNALRIIQGRISKLENAYVEKSEKCET